MCVAAWLGRRTKRQGRGMQKPGAPPQDRSAQEKALKARYRAKESGRLARGVSPSLRFRAFSAVTNHRVSLGRCPRLLHSAPLALRALERLQFSDVAADCFAERLQVIPTFQTGNYAALTRTCGPLLHTFGKRNKIFVFQQQLPEGIAKV